MIFLLGKRKSFGVLFIYVVFWLFPTQRKRADTGVDLGKVGSSPRTVSVPLNFLKFLNIKR